MTRSTREVLESHLALRRDGDLEGDLATNYTEDVVMLSCGEGVKRGHDGVRKLADILGTYVGHGEFEYHELVVDGPYGMLRWTAHAPDAKVPDGTDSFVVEDGQIVAQTIAYTVE